ncbi:MAG: tRNA pseudouridine(55) synthase TruB [Selenomonadales bacterium]|nr:tRNA pseudouridine(55) synthase TruB [Selenomonadales bacterium]
MSDGILNVYKPAGMTAHDVVGKIRRIYGQKKVGHGGTLDPDAAGVLPVFLGTATRLLEYAVEGTKAYRAEGCLGSRTTTGDKSGVVVEERPVPPLTRDDMEQVLARFRGPILQTPPMYSALKVNGRKLYQYARQGMEIERQPRSVEIHHLILREFDPPRFAVDVECSKGTYIRTLLEDIAAALGTVGHMTTLLRTRVGDYRLEEAHTLEEIAAAPDTVLLPVARAVRGLPRFDATPMQAYRITSGVATTIRGLADGTYALFGADVLLGIGTCAEEVLRARKILQHAERPPETDRPGTDSPAGEREEGRDTHDHRE